MRIRQQLDAIARLPIPFVGVIARIRATDADARLVLKHYDAPTSFARARVVGDRE